MPAAGPAEKNLIRIIPEKIKLFGGKADLKLQQNDHDRQRPFTDAPAEFMKEKRMQKTNQKEHTMQIHFWGTRGSLPAPATAEGIESKIFRAIRASQDRRLETDEAIQTFIRRELPFCVRESYGGNTSCVQILNEGEYVLCDAGTGLRDFGNAYMKALTSGKENLPKIFHIFMSHLHWDHIQGFPFFTPAYLPGNQVHIYGYHQDIRESFENQQKEPFFPVPLSAMQADISFHFLEEAKSYDIAGFQVTATKQRHPGDSYGYSFIKDGKKVVYSTDSEHQDDAKDEQYRFIDFFRNADLLIFDAQYNFLESVDAKANWGHSSNLLGVELGLRAGVRRLCLFHHEHTFDDETLDQFLSDTYAYQTILDKTSSMEISLSYDGLIIKI